MSLFCLDCFNEIEVKGKEKLTKKDVVLEYRLCEGCGEMKPCVVVIEKSGMYKILGKKKPKWWQIFKYL